MGATAIYYNSNWLLYVVCPYYASHNTTPSAKLTVRCALISIEEKTSEMKKYLLNMILEQ